MRRKQRLGQVYDSGKGACVRFMEDLEVQVVCARSAAAKERAEKQALAVKLAELAAENAQLAAQAKVAGKGKDSTDSGLPPSKDPIGTRHPRRHSGKRKPGGQKKREGKGRPLRPVSELTEPPHDVYPDACGHCGSNLSLAHWQLVGAPGRSQQCEIEILVHWREFRTHALRCPVCKHETRATLTPEQAECFGPNLQAHIASLIVKGHMSRSQAQRYVSEGFGAPLSAGSVTNILKRVGAACEPVRELIHLGLEREHSVYADETMWPCAHLNRYAWGLFSKQYAYFEIGKHRTREEARKLLRGCRGIIHTDRYHSAYDIIAAIQRQLCWEHIKRNFKAFTTGEDPTEAELEFGQRGFNLARRVLVADRKRPIPRKLGESFQAELRDILEFGAKHDSTRGMSEDLRIHWTSLWLILSNEHAHATNNLAERMIRQLVLKRKTSYGSGSETGALALAQIASVTTTCELQDVPAEEFLKDCIIARLRGQPPPALVKLAV